MTPRGLSIKRHFSIKSEHDPPPLAWIKRFRTSHDPQHFTVGYVNGYFLGGVSWLFIIVACQILPSSGVGPQLFWHYPHCSTDWFKGKSTENHRFSFSNGFSICFSCEQKTWKKTWEPIHLPYSSIFVHGNLLDPLWDPTIDPTLASLGLVLLIEALHAVSQIRETDGGALQLPWRCEMSAVNIQILYGYCVYFKWIWYYGCYGLLV